MRTFTKIRFVVATLVALALAPFSAHAQFVGGNATLSAGTVSSNVALPANTVTYPYVLIVPAEGSSNEVFYKLGLSSSVVATTSGPALPAGGVCINSGPNTYLAGITGSSTTTVRVTQVTLCPIYSGGAGAGGGGGGGTSSNFSSAFPSVGTAVGFSNGTNMVPGLVDGSGYLEVNVKAGGAGGGAVYGPTAVGSATANPPVSVGGSVDGTSTGNVGIWKVNSSGLGFVSATVTNWGSGSNTLGAMANYGTSPGAVLVPGVNAYVTNSIAVTGTFWPTTQPVSIASAQVASGAYAAGSIASGAMVDLGSQADSVCGSSTGSCSLIALIKYLNSAAVSAVPGYYATAYNTCSQVTGTTAPICVDLNGNMYANISRYFGTVASPNASIMTVQPAGGDPCQTLAKTYTPINYSSSGLNTTPLVAGASTKKTYVCQIILNNNAAETVGIIETTTATSCATDVQALWGGATHSSSSAGFQFAATSGVSIGNGTSTVAITKTANDDICFIQSQATQMTGGILWVQQ